MARALAPGPVTPARVPQATAPKAKNKRGRSASIAYPACFSPKRARASNVIAPIHVREKVIAPFAVREEIFIQVAVDQLIVESIKPKQVIGRPLRCVMSSRTRLNEECPVARLGEQ